MQIGTYLSTPRSERRKAAGLLPEARGSLLSASADVGSPVTSQNRPERWGRTPPRTSRKPHCACSGGDRASSPASLTTRASHYPPGPLGIFLSPPVPHIKPPPQKKHVYPLRERFEDGS